MRRPNPLIQNVVWQLHAIELRERMAHWSDQRLEDFARGFQNWDHHIPQAYLAEVARERQRRLDRLDTGLT